MLVNLIRSWFDPSATLREVRNNPHDLPDTWADILPKGATVIDDKGKVTDRGSETADLRKQIEASIRAKPENASLSDDEIAEMVEDDFAEKQKISAAPAPNAPAPVAAPMTATQSAAKAKDQTTESNKK